MEESYENIVEDLKKLSDCKIYLKFEDPFWAAATAWWHLGVFEYVLVGDPERCAATFKANNLL